MSNEEGEAKEARAAYRTIDNVTFGQGESRTSLRGVQYLVDEVGERKAVVISLELWGDLWEDFYDVLVSELRKDEPTVPWDSLRSEVVSEEPASCGL